MSITVNTLIKRALKTNNIKTKMNNLLRAIDLDSTNPLPIFYLARLEETYYDKALNALDLALTLEEDISYQAFITCLVIFIKYSKYEEAISLCERIHKIMDTCIDIDAIINILKLKLGKKVEIISPIESNINDLVLLYKEYKETGKISLQSYLDSLIYSSIWTDIILTKETFNLSIFYNIFAKNSIPDIPFFICSGYYSLFSLILKEELKSFYVAYDTAQSSFDIKTFLSEDENNILQAVFSSFDINKEITISNYFNNIYDICDYYTNFKDFAIRLKYIDIDEIKFYLDQLVRKHILFYENEYRITSFGKSIAYELNKDEDSRKLDMLTKAMDILVEGIEAEDTEESISFLQQAKEVFPLLYDADFFILLKQDKLTYESLLPIYYETKEIIQNYHISISLFDDDSIYGYYLASYKRMSDKLIELALYEKRSEIITLLDENISFFKSLSPINYAIYNMIAAKNKNKKLLKYLEKFEFPVLNDEYFLFLDLIRVICLEEKKQITKIFQILNNINPYICGILFNFIQANDELLDTIYPLDDYRNISLTKMDIAVNLANIFYLVFPDNIILPYKNLYMDAIDEYTSSSVIDQSLVFLKEMFSIKPFIKKNSILNFFSGNEKTEKCFKILPSFDTAKKYKNSNVFSKENTNIIIDSLILHNYLIKTPKGYVLTLYGVTIIKNKYSEKTTNYIS